MKRRRQELSTIKWVVYWWEDLLLFLPIKRVKPEASGIDGCNHDMMTRSTGGRQTVVQLLLQPALGSGRPIRQLRMRHRMS